MEVFTDRYFMNEALKEAKKAFDNDEVPVGAVVVVQDQIIAKAYNQVELLKDPTAHAEMLAITSAANFLGSKYLTDCTIYITLEPCLMCASALFWSKISRVVFAAADDKNGFMRLGKGVLHPKTKVEYGLMEPESRVLLQSFFEQKRK
ncbi:MAG TPA: nucleoside deaminase [Saprospiraceae bacterium]|nr:tRNA-specific adenosine deaminase [Saprospirales bacterium]HRQ30470.1 nucleoside deaminase [Saprospiraceae bacterium]